MPALTVAQLGELCGGEAHGNTTRVITGANSLEHAQPSDLSFVANQKAAALALSSEAGCLLVPISFAGSGPWSLIRVEDPRAAFASILAALYPSPRAAPGIHPSA